jgi:hypothetical protein
MYESPFWVGWSAGSWGTSWGYDSTGKPIEVESELVPAGHWKHLFRPIRAVTTHEVSARGVTRFAVERPETFDLRQSADAVAVSVRGVVRTARMQPTTGVSVGPVQSRHVSVAYARRPKCSARAPFIRSQAYTRVETRSPSTGCNATSVSLRRRTHHAYWTPTTVQNPTPEMIYTLLAA